MAAAAAASARHKVDDLRSGNVSDRKPKKVARYYNTITILILQCFLNTNYIADSEP